MQSQAQIYTIFVTPISLRRMLRVVSRIRLLDLSRSRQSPSQLNGQKWPYSQDPYADSNLPWLPHVKYSWSYCSSSNFGFAVWGGHSGGHCFTQSWWSRVLDHNTLYLKQMCSQTRFRLFKIGFFGGSLFWSLCSRLAIPEWLLTPICQIWVMMQCTRI